MTLVDHKFPESVPGVFNAQQGRSMRIRDGFIAAGVKALETQRFANLSVSQLAKMSGNSVGSFYSRFEDKDAYFRALQVSAVQSLDRNLIDKFSSDIQNSPSSAAALALLVDLLCNIFGSKYRGVLRESLLRILDSDDPWAPMRQSAKRIISILHNELCESFDGFTKAQTQERLSFCFQMIVGVLQNDLVNDYHVYSLKDGSVREGLKAVIYSYMNLDKDKA